MEVLENMAKIIWQDSLSIMVEYISMIDLIKDEREKHKYVYKAFSYNNTNYLIFFSRYKHLFNMNLDHLSVLLILILMRKIVDNRMICNKQECE